MRRCRCGRDVYVSHYPSRELDRNPEAFATALRSTVDNDIGARFLPSYEAEAAGWCESTMQVQFESADVGRVRAFFEHYREREIYNLTRRNCSTTAVLALDYTRALFGALREGRTSVFDGLKGRRETRRSIQQTDAQTRELVRETKERISRASTGGL